jgi:hypothetical protein
VKETIFSFLFYLLYLFIVTNVILILLSINSLDVDSLDYQQNNLAYAHIFGGGQTIKNIDKYQIKFRTSPSVILADNNSTTKLNFSIQHKNNTDVYDVFAALTIKEKNPDKVVAKIPYRLYEFGDITFPYVFEKSADYQVSLEARIAGDPKYEENPLVINFDVSVGISFNEFIIYFVLPIITAITVAGLIFYYISRKSAGKIRQ